MGWQARLGRVFGIASNAAGDVWIADADAHRVRFVSAATGIITT
jgi:hypothetical protein